MGLLKKKEVKGSPPGVVTTWLAIDHYSKSYSIVEASTFFEAKQKAAAKFGTRLEQMSILCGFKEIK